MLGAGGASGGRVTCPACGDSVPRSRAREYDKYGDRWARRNKSFEYFCKDCHDDLCHHNRADLEALLLRLEREADSTRDFLARYHRELQERSPPSDDH